MNDRQVQVKPGVYKHYKGKYYQVLYIGKHTESLEDVVIYKALYNHLEFGDRAICVRPISNFTSMVDIEGEKIPRFKLLSALDITRYIFERMSGINQVSDE